MESEKRSVSGTDKHLLTWLSLTKDCAETDNTLNLSITSLFTLHSPLITYSHNLPIPENGSFRVKPV